NELRAGRRAPRVLRVPGRGSSGRGRAYDRSAGRYPRRSGARGARPVTLAGRGAVVTGGSRGIGLAVARALAEAGAAVVVAARAPDRLPAVAAELGGAGRRAWAVACDVADPEGVRTLAREAESRLGPVDLLVTNAGISHSAPVQKTTLEDWNRLLTVNFPVAEGAHHRLALGALGHVRDREAVERRVTVLALLDEQDLAASARHPGRLGVEPAGA